MEDTLIFVDNGFFRLVQKEFKIKKEKGSNRMVEPCNCLTHDKKLYEWKYLNVSIGDFYGYAGVAEWLMQLPNTQCPLGLTGSIPVSGVTFLKEGVKNETE